MRNIKKHFLNFTYNISLMGQYLLLMGIVSIIFFISFIITDKIAKDIIIGEGKEMNQTMLDSAESKLENYYDSLESISYNIAYNSGVISFMDSLDKLERLMKFDDVFSVVTNTRLINKNIAQVSLYEEQGQLVFNVGSTDIGFTKRPELKNNALITYSGKLTGKDGKGCFGIEVILYDLDKPSFGSGIGSCFMVLKIEELEDIVTNLSAVDSADIILLDSAGEILAWNGSYQNDLTWLNTLSTNDNYLFGVRTIRKTGWKLISAVPKSAFYPQVSRLQIINRILYTVVVIIMLFMAVVMYFSILRPIKKLAIFMKNHPNNPKGRLQKIYHNEIGKLSESLNNMLDDVVELHEQVYTEQKKVYEAQVARKQTEMIAFRSQINPHFLYNTFECIRGMALYYEQYDIASLSEALHTLYRYNVKDGEFATLEQEARHIDVYAKIIAYRFNDRYTINLLLDDTLKLERVPKMLIQPLVENAVFHGLELSLVGDTVEVFVKDLGDQIEITVNDNGIGMEKDVLHQLQVSLQMYNKERVITDIEHGVGVMNIYRRLKLFYEEDGEFIIQSEKDQGTSVIIRIPKRYWGD